MKSATLEEKELLWGTYGKGAMEAYMFEDKPLPPMKLIKLGDCNTEHLEAILKNQNLDVRSPKYYTAIKNILEDR
jgi:hypothetical protein